MERMEDCVNNFEGFCVEFDDEINENFCEQCSKDCPFYEKMELAK